MWSHQFKTWSLWSLVQWPQKKTELSYFLSSCRYDFLGRRGMKITYRRPASRTRRLIDTASVWERCFSWMGLFLRWAEQDWTNEFQVRGTHRKVALWRKTPPNVLFFLKTGASEMNFSPKKKNPSGAILPWHRSLRQYFILALGFQKQRAHWGFLLLTQLPRRKDSFPSMLRSKPGGCCAISWSRSSGVSSPLHQIWGRIP